MPANLPPQYYELEREYTREHDPREKLRLAKELLRVMPKHKGTDKLQAEMKAKISKLKKQIDGGAKSHGARQATAHDHIDKEGAGQVILIGPPNCGKSSLVETLTHAKPIVADYPYTTREPMTGMTVFETVQIQLIDTPPISSEMYENYLSGLIRNCDLVVMVADLAAKTMVEDIRFILSKLEEKRIILQSEVTEEPEDPRLCYRKTIVCGHRRLKRCFRDSWWCRHLSSTTTHWRRSRRPFSTRCQSCAFTPSRSGMIRTIMIPLFSRLPEP